MTQNIGPVQLLAVGFDADANFEGRIIDELEILERHETIRILDLLFVGKDAETGDLLALDYQGEELGAIVGALLGFDFEGEEPYDPSEIEAHAFGLSQSEIRPSTWASSNGSPSCASRASSATRSSRPRRSRSSVSDTEERVSIVANRVPLRRSQHCTRLLWSAQDPLR